MEARIILPVTIEKRAEIRELAAKVVDAAGRPHKGVEVRFHLEKPYVGNLGQGGGAYAEEATATTNDDGDAFITWYEYPRYEPRRAFESIVIAECNERGELGLRMVLQVVFGD